MTTNIEKAKKEFLQTIDDFGADPYRLRNHVPEAEKWARRLLKDNPEADVEVVLLSVWLHDIGHYPVPTDIDHAVRGERRTKEFLEKIGYPKDKMDKVLHCIRSHRCKDVMPNTIEAKIIACVDSASHMTEPMYFDMARVDKENGSEFRAYAKMDRDFRDLEAFPEIQNELKEIYENWKKLIKSYEKLK